MTSKSEDKRRQAWIDSGRCPRCGETLRAALMGSMMICVSCYENIDRDRAKIESLQTAQKNNRRELAEARFELNSAKNLCERLFTELDSLRAERDAAKSKASDLQTFLFEGAILIAKAANELVIMSENLSTVTAERDALAHDPNNDRALIRLRRSQVMQYKRARRYTRRYALASRVIGRQAEYIDELESELAGRRMDTSDAFI